MALTTKKDIEGVPLVLNYKYLGVPLDSALILKHLFTFMKEKVKKFNQRVGLVLSSVVGTAAKLNLWQAYARCYFNYFSPAIAICNRLDTFEPLFTGSLKKALDLPLRLPNEHLLKVAGIPTLAKIAGYHLKENKETILRRFNRLAPAKRLYTEVSNRRR